MSWALRRYRDADARACWDLFHRAIRIGAADHYSQAERDAWSPAPRRLTRARRAWLSEAVTWVACDGETLAGFMLLERDGHLDLAFVDPDHTRRGIASALLARIEEVATTLGLTRLHTEASRVARPFFLSRGWTLIGPETVRRNGVALQRFRMTRDLKEDA